LIINDLVKNLITFKVVDVNDLLVLNSKFIN